MVDNDTESGAGADDNVSLSCRVTAAQYKCSREVSIPGYHRGVCQGKITHNLIVPVPKKELPGEVSVEAP